MDGQGELVKLRGINVNETKLVTGLFLTHSNEGNRVQILVPAGCGRDYIARIRMYISRLRVSVRNARAIEKQFIFRAEYYPYTEDGKRYDAIVMWQEQTTVHLIITELVKAGLDE